MSTSPPPFIKNSDRCISPPVSQPAYSQAAGHQNEDEGYADENTSLNEFRPHHQSKVLQAVYSTRSRKFNLRQSYYREGAARRRGDRIATLFAAIAHSRFWHKADLARCLPTCLLSARSGHAVAAADVSIGRE
jgi:hypothetical protein